VICNLALIGLVLAILVSRSGPYLIGRADPRLVAPPDASLIFLAIRSLVLLGLGLIVAPTSALLWAPAVAAQGEPILRFEGKVTSVSPGEMLVAAEREGVVVDVVMVDLVRIPQSETRQIAQDDIVIVIGFIRRPGHKVIATSGQFSSLSSPLLLP
jgi:hypothetical protein